MNERKKERERDRGRRWGRETNMTTSLGRYLHCAFLSKTCRVEEQHRSSWQVRRLEIIYLSVSHRFAAAHSTRKSYQLWKKSHTVNPICSAYIRFCYAFRLVLKILCLVLSSSWGNKCVRPRSYFVFSATRKERFGARPSSVAEDEADEHKSGKIGSISKRTECKQDIEDVL